MILTNTGRDKINAVLGTDNPTVEWKYIAFGNGSGQNPTFTPETTDLVNEVWRGEVLDIYRDDTNSAWVYFQTVIPPEDGDFYVREIGIFDNEGDLVAVGSFPTSYKPKLENSSVVKTIHTKTAVQIENADNVTFSIDPSVVMASQSWVVSNFQKKDEVYIFDTSNGDVNYTLPSDKDDGYTVSIIYKKGNNKIKVSPPTGQNIAGVEDTDTADIDVISITQFILYENRWYIRRG